MADRTGVTPAARPTEWTTAVVLLATAVLAWRTDHNTAALVAVLGATLPIIVTTATTWYDNRQTP